MPELWSSGRVQPTGLHRPVRLLYPQLYNPASALWKLSAVAMRRLRRNLFREATVLLLDTVGGYDISGPQSSIRRLRYGHYFGTKR